MDYMNGGTAFVSHGSMQTTSALLVSDKSKIELVRVFLADLVTNLTSSLLSISSNTESNLHVVLSSALVTKDLSLSRDQ